jgi:hypothetical protein
MPIIKSFERLRRARPRAVGAIAAAGLALTAAGVIGPSLASSTGPAMQMTGMATTLSTAGNSVGTTPGWYAGHTVTFTYTKNFVCKRPPVSHASSACEAGSDYESIPARTFDPLYVVVPIGFSPAKKTLNCPVAGKCIDHPHTIDLSGVFNSSTYDNVKLPAHSHIITTTNAHQSEWWDVVVIGVTKQTTWNKIVAAKSYGEVTRLRNAGSNAVTGNIPTNLFLYFKAS